MSHVTSVIVTTESMDLCHEDRQGELVPSEEMSALGFREVTAHAGGDKHVQARVYLAAFNYFDIAEFVKKVRALPWEYPEMVQVFVKDENDERFKRR